jgi:branched-chain amino acid transport system substrate-binding protein
MNKERWIVNGVCIAAIAVGLLSGCTGRKPILVGFAGELTGRNADLGVQGRNGAEMAVEKINAEGGIANRSIRLIVRDDQGKPEGARDAAHDLIEAGVTAIIGHMTSEQSLAALPLINEAGVVLLSPTTSTAELSGIEDYFFRVNPVNALAAHALARHIYQEYGAIKLATIYDTDNAGYTQIYLAAFREAYRALGGQIISEVSFSSAEEPDFGTLITTLESHEPEGLLIIASAVDTALIAQHTQLAGWEIPLFSSGWAQTEALLQNGGEAVEGMKIVTNFNSNSRDPDFLDFQAQYLERFGQAPTFAAAQTYEAVLFLAAALEKTRGSAKGLPQALITTEIKGLTGHISLDAYGDVVRTQFLLSIKDGEFVTRAALEMETTP